MSDLHLRRIGSSIDSIVGWPTVRSKAWTSAFLELADRDENIIAVVAVGSAVRPDVASIDLDLVIICKEPDKLKAKQPIEVDLRAYSAAEVDVLIGAGNDMLGWAAMYGRRLFQREQFWDAVVDKWQRRLPLPSADVAVRRADEAFHRLRKVFELGDTDAAHEQAVSYLTHVARAELLKAGVYPTSRPELPNQLRTCGRPQVAAALERLLDRSSNASETIAQLVESRPLTGG